MRMATSAEEFRIADCGLRISAPLRDCLPDACFFAIVVYLRSSTGSLQFGVLKFRNSKSAIRNVSCPLIERIPALAIKVVEVFRFDEIVAGFAYTFEQGNDLRMHDGRAFAIGQEPA